MGANPFRHQIRIRTLRFYRGVRKTEACSVPDGAVSFPSSNGQELLCELPTEGYRVNLGVDPCHMARSCPAGFYVGLVASAWAAIAIPNGLCDEAIASIAGYATDINGHESILASGFWPLEMPIGKVLPEHRILLAHLSVSERAAARVWDAVSGTIVQKVSAKARVEIYCWADGKTILESPQKLVARADGTKRPGYAVPTRKTRPISELLEELHGNQEGPAVDGTT